MLELIFITYEQMVEKRFDNMEDLLTYLKPLMEKTSDFTIVIQKCDYQMNVREAESLLL